MKKVFFFPTIKNLGKSGDRLKDIYHLSFKSEESLNITRHQLDDLKIHYIILLGHILTDKAGVDSLKEYNS